MVIYDSYVLTIKVLSISVNLIKSIVLGTIRFNLDPNGNNSDNELWTALEHSYLKKHVKDYCEGNFKNWANFGYFICSVNSWNKYRCTDL